MAYRVKSVFEIAVWLLIYFGSPFIWAESITPKPELLRALAGEAEETLRKNDIEAWFPRCVDEKRGGFLCNFDRAWNPSLRQPKTLVFQSRMTWVASQIVKRRPDLAPQFRKVTRHGADFLFRWMWDENEGGFFWELGDGDKASESNATEKHAYGISFAIYALASAGSALGDKTYIERAIEAFRWLDIHAHDDRNGGYFEALYRDGHPMLTAPVEYPSKTRDAISSPLGCKSMNTHVHLLESFTELYRVWPDKRLRVRLEELMEIVVHHIYVPPGMQGMFFLPDWTLLPTTISYGQDVETAYLMLDAAMVLGRSDDPAVWKMARSLVDQALQDGWDEKNGGFYDIGNALMGPTGSHEKVWWAQAEGLNALLLMHERYGNETSLYWKCFLKQWNFIRTGCIDSKYGGWLGLVGEDGSLLATGTGKGHPWKAAYHTGRALMNVADLLNQMAKKDNRIDPRRHHTATE